VQFKRETSGNTEVWREGKNNPTTLLDIETEKLKKEQADLETEFQKVSFTVAVLDIATTTNLLCGETLIDKRPINIDHFYWKFLPYTHKSTIWPCSQLIKSVPYIHFPFHQNPF